MRFAAVLVTELAGRRIALVTTARQKGGVWRHIEDLGVELQRRKAEVLVVLDGTATALQRAARAAGLCWMPIRRALDEPRIDVWHTHLADTYDRPSAIALAARRLRGRCVITEHLPRNHASDPGLERHVPRRAGAAHAKTIFKRTELSLAGAVIACGRSSAAFIEARYRVPPGTVLAVNNGVPPAPAPAAAQLDGPLRVVAIGSVIRQKGYDVLIEAARLAREDWTVRICGEGVHRAALQAVAGDLPPGRICFAGWREDPRAEIRAAHVVCMPSRWESFPYVALEAGSLGRATVASEVDGLDEIVVPGRTGALVAPADPRALAAQLDALAREPAQTVRWGAAAYERVQSRYTLDGMVERVGRVYEKVWRP